GDLGQTQLDAAPRRKILGLACVCRRADLLRRRTSHDDRARARRQVRDAGHEQTGRPRPSFAGDRRRRCVSAHRHAPLSHRRKALTRALGSLSSIGKPRCGPRSHYQRGRLIAAFIVVNVSAAAMLGIATSASADTLEAIRARGTLIWGADAEGGGPYVYP